MATEPTGTNSILENPTLWTDEQLADEIFWRLTAEAEVRDRRQRLERELQRRLEARSATELAHPTLEVKLEYPSPSYDHGKLLALGELVSMEEWAKAYSPEHLETRQVVVPANLDMRKARGWPKRFGAEVAAVLERAKLPGGPPKLRIKAKGVS